MSVCMHVCSSIFASGARTAGRIGTGEYSFDPPKRRTVAAFAELARQGPKTGSTVYEAMKTIA